MAGCSHILCSVLDHCAVASKATAVTLSSQPGSNPGHRSKLYLRHIELAEANSFVEALHRHHKRIQGHRFSLGCEDAEGLLRGVAIVGRPVGGQHQGDWVEVTRMCTDGTPNACSFLYSAVARAAQALGFHRAQTYILADEPGTSLKAAGWQFERMSHPVGWHHDTGRSARKVPQHLMERKQLWYRDLNFHLLRKA